MKLLDDEVYSCKIREFIRVLRPIIPLSKIFPNLESSIAKSEVMDLIVDGPYDLLAEFETLNLSL